MPKDTKNPSGGHDAACAIAIPRCGWRSTGWPTAEQAQARLAEHMAEHRTGDPAPELFLSEAALSALPEDEVEARRSLHAQEG